MTDPTPWIVAEDDGADRKHAPATFRNREPIAQALAGILPVTGRVLEIASGSGEHVAFFARRFPAIVWQPSDPDAAARRSIASWCAELDNVAPPIALDAAARDWQVDAADAILCSNMVHISPWEATLGLLAGAARILPAKGSLLLYGPFLRSGHATAPSNLAFDASLRQRCEGWGLRALDAVDAAAAEQGLERRDLREMPANNLLLVYRRA